MKVKLPLQLPGPASCKVMTERKSDLQSLSLSLSRGVGKRGLPSAFDCQSWKHQHHEDLRRLWSSKHVAGRTSLVHPAASVKATPHFRPGRWIQFCIESFREKWATLQSVRGRRGTHMAVGQNQETLVDLPTSLAHPVWPFPWSRRQVNLPGSRCSGFLTLPHMMS